MGELLLYAFTPQMLLYAGVSLLPILGWIVLFQKIHPERKWYVVLTFVAGMFSVLPIKLYEKYWNQGIFFFQHINLFSYFEEVLRLPDIARFLSYISMHAIVALGFFLFVALMMFVLEVILSGDNSLRVFRIKFQKILESPFFFMSVGLIAGGIAFLFSLFQGGDISLADKVSFFVVVGLLEEYIKYLVLRFSDDEKIQSPDDALSFSVLVALGFAFIENIMYLNNFVQNVTDSFLNVLVFFLLRSTISVTAHVCFSAILGYFYGISRFATEICREETFRLRHPFFIWMHRFLHCKKETLFHEEKLMEGMLLAMGAHIVFNTLLNFDLIAFVIPFLFFLFLTVLSLFHRKYFYEQNGHIDRIPSVFREGTG